MLKAIITYERDHRKISFISETFSFGYSINTIPLLSKKDVEITLDETVRVLKTNGLCFLNFISIDNEVIADSYFEGNELDKYFIKIELLGKEKK